jgi:hypothetical protein
MQTQIYKIDDNQLGNLMKRLTFRNLRMLGVMLVIFFGVQFLAKGQSNVNNIVPALVIIPLLLIPVYLATQRLKKNYASLQIILSDAGVECKANMMPYKCISWDNLLVEEKPNGVINLYDSGISSFSRKMNGRGWINIQPEILNRDQLLMEMMKYKRC